MKIPEPIRRLVTVAREGNALDTALRAARLLVGSGGESGGVQTATGLSRAFRALTAADIELFFLALVDEFGPDHERLARAADAYLDQPGEPTASALHEGSQPVRQTLLRRLNMAPGGTEMILGMRAAVLRLLKQQPRLAPLEADLRHLLASWFNRGFLELIELDWQSSAELLENLIRYEAVHAMNGWEDLHKRLSDRRLCFAFVHPALPQEPLIFVEVALTGSVSRRIAPLLEGDAELVLPTAAIFYSISNCQAGLRGIPLGNLLIKQIVANLGSRWPTLTSFATLSPVPGFRRWLNEGAGRALVAPAFLAELEACGADLPPPAFEGSLVRLCSRYLTRTSIEDRDPVAQFHLSNGARLERINWAANLGEKGISESFGIMVNYAYRLPSMARNRERLLAGRSIACAPRVAAQARLPTKFRGRFVDDIGQNPT